MSSKAFDSRAKHAITRLRLKRLAGNDSFQRGEKYFTDAAVDLLTLEHDLVMARVKGTKRYRCKLWLVAGILEAECTCRAFYNKGFCKHLVAVGLACLVAKKSAWNSAGRLGAMPRRPQSRLKSSISIEHVREYLSKSVPGDLLEMLCVKVMSDSGLLSLFKLKILGEQTVPVRPSASREKRGTSNLVSSKEIRRRTGKLK